MTTPYTDSSKPKPLAPSLSKASFQNQNENPNLPNSKGGINSLIRSNSTPTKNNNVVRTPLATISQNNNTIRSFSTSNLPPNANISTRRNSLPYLSFQKNFQIQSS